MNVMTWKGNYVFFSQARICSRLHTGEDDFQQFETPSAVNCLAPDGTSVVLQRVEDRVVEVRRVVQRDWRMNSVEFACHVQIPILRSITWSCDSRLLALGSADGTIHVCKAKVGREKERGKVVKSFPRGEHVHQKFTAETLTFSPNSTLIASASLPGEIAVWEVDTGRLRATAGIQEYCPVLAWSPNGKSIAFGGRGDVHVYIWRITAQKPSPISCRRGGASARALAWSPDSSLLATGDSAGHIFLWDTSSEQPLREWGSMGAEIEALAWSPDGRKLIAVAAESFDFFDL